MILLVDIGNSRMKWGWWDGHQMHGGGAGRHGGELPAEFLQSAPRGVVPTKVLVSSVAGPALNDALRDTVQYHWSADCRFLVSPPAALGVRNAYAQPATLGPDRWAVLMAAWSQGLAPACIVDCGTAVTVDVLDGTGCHRGGVIFAGLHLSRDALGRGTYRLQSVGEGGLPVLAADTATAIRTGTLQALTGSIGYLIQQVTGELKASPTLLLTGGDAELVADKLEQYNPTVQLDLVLRGLVVMAEEI